jgi:hypothetical protein
MLSLEKPLHIWLFPLISCKLEEEKEKRALALLSVISHLLVLRDDGQHPARKTKGSGSLEPSCSSEPLPGFSYCPQQKKPYAGGDEASEKRAFR